MRPCDVASDPLPWTPREAILVPRSQAMRLRLPSALPPAPSCSRGECLPPGPRAHSWRAGSRSLLLTTILFDSPPPPHSSPGTFWGTGQGKVWGGRGSSDQAQIIFAGVLQSSGLLEFRVQDIKENSLFFHKACLETQKSSSASFVCCSLWVASMEHGLHPKLGKSLWLSRIPRKENIQT